MQSLFQRTRARVHTPDARRQEETHGLESAFRTAASIQLGAQLLLWITFFGYDEAQQTIWQAVLMLVLPLGLLWLLWRKTNAAHPAARWWLLLLLLCLLPDAVFLLTASGGFITQLVPTYPTWVCTVIPAALCVFASLRSQKRGVWYGCAVLAVPLVILLFFGTIFLRASTRADRLWPIWGNGWLHTAQCALNGTGSLWSAALLFVLPGTSGKAVRKSWLWLIIPWLLCALWALWFGFVRPWAAGDTLVAAEKMMGLARHANSVLLYETAGVMWMLLLPAALTACFSTAEMLFTQAMPRFPRWAALMILPFAAVFFALFQPEWMSIILPWRFLISLLCAAVLLFACRRRA